MDSEAFRDKVAVLLENHKPSRHNFFARLAAFPTQQLSPELLDELYKRYQAAMHASRVMGYFIPHLEAVSLRTRKLSILADDDGIFGGDTHHYQLRRTWTFMLGRPPLMEDDEFGDLNELKKRLDTDTANFVALSQELYPKSLGPWVAVEGLAHDWIGALLKSLLPHFPGVDETDYFTQNYSNCLEEKHAEESLNVTVSILARRPELAEDTMEGVSKMSAGIDALWTGLENFIIGISK